DPVFPDPDDIELVTVAATPVSGIDACLGTGPGSGADAPCPKSVPPTTIPTTAPPTTAPPSSTAGAGAQADDDDSGSDASVVITSSGDSSGSGGSDAAAITTGAPSNGSLAHTGTGVSGPVLAGVMLIACGAMVLAARRRENRFA
nr:LPXTG cell wall anchor domain-containing protein [Microthrixaceae bacterium]